MYVAVKGGEVAIDNAHSWMSEIRRGDTSIPNITLDQISEQLTLGVDRVMSEGSLYDKDLAALAIKQSRGNLIEAPSSLGLTMAQMDRNYGNPTARRRAPLCSKISILALPAHL